MDFLEKETSTDKFLLYQNIFLDQFKIIIINNIFLSNVIRVYYNIPNYNIIPLFESILFKNVYL